MNLTPPATPLSNVDERLALLQTLMARAKPSVVDTYHQKLLVSWIYHDSSIDGTVYELSELMGALAGKAPADATLIPVFDEIRRHKAAIDIVKELTEKKRTPLSLDVVKDIYNTLDPEEEESKGQLHYRKDMPMHRIYYHEIAAPEKIGVKLRQLMEWIVLPETVKAMHPIRLAGRLHYHFLQIYPFPKHNGKVARLLMNLILLRNSYPPAIIHSTERQRYFDSLKQPPNTLSTLVHEALIASVDSGIRYFETMEPPVARQEGKKRRRKTP